MIEFLILAGFVAGIIYFAAYRIDPTRRPPRDIDPRDDDPNDLR